MQKTVVPGVAMWSVWQPDRNLFFNSYFIETPQGNLAIDPLPLSETDAQEIAARGGIRWVVITNRDHERDSANVRERFGASVAAATPDSAELRVPVERTLGDRDLLATARILALDGLKTAGEFALWFGDRRTIVVGDALWGDPAGSVRLMPDEKLADPAAAALSLRRLRARNPLHLLVGDGTPIFGRAFEVISACLDARAGVFTNRVNLDELVIERSTSGPAPFRAGWAEIGQLIGARRLGYQLALLAPGDAFCPLHWHTAEEELFIVWEGEPTLRSPRGETRLRPGDLVAFPTDPAGAHKLINESDAPCKVLMIANNDPHDVCFYPDSKKHLVEATETLVRSEPILDYYDGEV
ncbi:MAG TPA: cupin domain-containing protein [Candidatus Acidoferrales bacterium]|nr:cupin domain-containing protein [Candidatus Acidoferrales bacterium]